MGYTIIKASGNAYALNRSRQNLTPVESKYRKSIPNNAEFEYNLVTSEGICTLKSVDLKGGTLPYVYRLCTNTGAVITVGSRAGFTINEINGRITLDNNYDGLDVYVKLLPLQIQDHPDFYPTVATSIFRKVISAGDWSPSEPEDPLLDEYTLLIAYNNSLGLSAEEHNSVPLTTFILKKNNIPVISDVTEMHNAVEAGTLSLVTHTDANWITTTDIRNIKVFKNEGSARDAQVWIICTYENLLITSNNYAISLGAKSLVSVENVSGPTTVTIGTTLIAGNYSATGTYSNGDTDTVYANSISPNTVTEGANTYTLAFDNNVTGTILITGLGASLEVLLDIAGIAESPYSVENARISSSNPNIIELPLSVVVNTNTGLKVMKFEDYILQSTETYGNPVLTFSTHGSFNNMPKYETTITNGTLVYDLSKDNYVFDNTGITNIRIPHSPEDMNLAINIETHLATEGVTLYFNNFNEELITSNSTYVAETLNTYHISSSSNYDNGKMKLSSNGVIYKLNKQSDYYLKVVGEGDGAIVTTSIDLNNSNLDSNSKEFTFGNGDVKSTYPGSPTKWIYIHHTPSDSNLDTYILDGSSSSSGTYNLYYILIPKNQSSNN